MNNSIPATILYQCPSRNILDFVYIVWWESVFKGGHFSTCKTRKKWTPVTFFYTWNTFFYGQGVISLRRKITPSSIFDGVVFVVSPATPKKSIHVTCKRYIYLSKDIVSNDIKKHDSKNWSVVCGKLHLHLSESRTWFLNTSALRPLKPMRSLVCIFAVSYYL